MEDVFLETPRLTLRRLTPDDSAALRPILGDPAVMTAWEHGFSDEDIAAWLQTNLMRYARGGYSYCAALERQSGQLVGVTGLLTEEVEGEALLGIAYIYRRDRWGTGLAREGAAACLTHAFSALKAEQVVATIRTDNSHSRHLAESLGMTPHHEFIRHYRGKAMPHLLYVLKSAQWPLAPPTQMR